MQVLPVAPAVQPDLAHHHGALACKGVQACEVRLKALLGLEVHVEAHEVEEVEPEILGRRVVDVGDEALGIFVLGGAVQPLEVALDPAAAEPARYGRGDLVTDGITQQGGVSRARPHAGPDQGLDVGGVSALVRQEPDVALHRKPDHDAQVVALRGVEQPARRHAIGADGVDPVRRHEREVPLHDGGLGDLSAVGAGAEGAVGHAPDVELFVPDEEELAPRARPRRCRGRCVRALRSEEVCRGRDTAKRRASVWNRRHATQEWNAIQESLSHRFRRLPRAGPRVVFAASG